MTFLKLLKPIAEPKIQPCAWRVGSTNYQTGKSELPEFCKRAGCDGTSTEGIMRECKRYTRG